MGVENRNIKIDDKIKNAYINSFSGTGENLCYLTLIASKILISNRECRKIEIDIDRLYDEFVYFKYYGKINQEYLLNFFLPLILVNRLFDNYVDDVVALSERLCKFYGITPCKYRYIMDVFCYDYIIRELLMGRVDMIETLIRIKDSLIELNPFQNNKKKNISFQIEKIKYIEAIHKVIDYYKIENQEEIYETGIEIVDIFQNVFLGASVSNGVSNVIYSLLQFNPSCSEIKNIELIESMADYILKLRYFEIESQKYAFKSSPRTFLEKNIGDEFLDPILNRVKILSKDRISECGIEKYRIILSSKTGIYEFKYNIKM